MGVSPDQGPEEAADEHRSEAASKAAARARIEQQQTWVDQQVQQAIRRGDFDNLPGAGKPIEGLGTEHDPDWWLRRLIERERIIVLPASVQLRKDDAALDGELDQMAREKDVRAAVESFNARVLKARVVPEGPPLITLPRDVEQTVAAWRARRAPDLAHRDTPPERAPGQVRRRLRWRRR